MFYRLTHIDDVPLPATVPMDGRPIPVAAGGLLLEPPSVDGSFPFPDGYSILWLHGEPTADALPDLVIHSSEPYRWSDVDQLDISRPASAAGLRMRGRRDGTMLIVETEPAPHAIGRTSLTFVEAGDEPIPVHWKRETFFPIALRRRRDALTTTDPELAWQLEDQEARELEQVRRADARRVTAWRAPA